MAGSHVLVYFILLLITSSNFLTSTFADKEMDLDDVDVDTDNIDNPTNVQENVVEYVSPVLSDQQNVYLAEHFDDPDKARARWQYSRARKEDMEGSKYDGVWEFQLPQRPIFPNDRALVLKSKAKHAAISAKLRQPFYFKSKPLFVQYEVTFQNGMDCGGAYIKLLSHSSNMDLVKFTDKTPYTIMFGPDKCGNDYKLHFIFRHKNPINGTFEEKHAKKPSNRLEEVYTDKKPHLYLLKLFPDNSFQVYVDGSLVNSGSLLTDMTPPINPPMEIPDVDDKKPLDWDERENIPDESATKPEDWDENAPAKISDPAATIPDGWLVDEKPMIPDTTAKKPEDWEDSMDGEWEPPLLTNPACEGAPGCGIWTAPLIDNPNFKGKWKQPMISNPNYKGKWVPRMIPNPDYFEDKEPFKMTSIGALGIEIWTMTDYVLFDNFLITDSESVLSEWTKQTFDVKKQAIDKDSEGVITRTLNYTNAHPWLWAVYLVVIALPVVLIITFCCGSSQDKKQELHPKKTDAYVEDEPETDVPEASKNSKVESKRSLKENLDEMEEDRNDDDVVEDSDDEEQDENESQNSLENSHLDDDEESKQDEDFVEPELSSSEVLKKRRPRLDK